MSKLRRPDGWVVEYWKHTEWYKVSGETCRVYASDPDDCVTGKFCFKFRDGGWTKDYTKKTAPKWLLSLYEEATGR